MGGQPVSLRQEGPSPQVQEWVMHLVFSDEIQSQVFSNIMESVRLDPKDANLDVFEINGIMENNGFISVVDYNSGSIEDDINLLRSKVNNTFLLNKTYWYRPLFTSAE